MSEVFVVGSVNQDFVLRLERRPEPGETVTDAELALFPGGKGANQAVAAVRLLGEGRVAMRGRVGDDAQGPALVRNLRENGIVTEHVETVAGVPSGAAFITVTSDGENAIVVSPGANRSLGPEEVEAAAKGLRGCRVLVSQLEVEVAAVERAAGIVTGSGGRFVLNLAPPRPVSDSLLGMCDPLVVNEHEAAYLLGEEADPEQAARRLLERGPTSAVITLGAEGALLASPGETEHVSAPEVEAVDTTGAGDAFVGALAARLSAGSALGEAVPYAVRAGAAAVGHAGAQGSLPTPEEVESL